MTDLVKYEKQIVIETFDGTLYFTPESNYNALKLALKTDRFIELNEELINTSTIKKTYLAEGEAGLTLEQKRTLDGRKKEFKDKLGRDPTQSEIGKMILKFKTQQDERVAEEIKHPKHRFTEEDLS